MRRLSPTLLTLLLGLGWACDKPDLPAPYSSLEAPEALLLSVQAQDRGREHFLTYCAICHGEKADGRGVRRMLSSPATDFTDRAWQRRSVPAYIYYIIREGKQGTPMPSWKVLDESETWDLVAYILSVADEAP
ncbi:MAG: cytochrome c [Thermoanaerobaculia bacterium]